MYNDRFAGMFVDVGGSDFKTEKTDAKQQSSDHFSIVFSKGILKSKSNVLNFYRHCASVLTYRRNFSGSDYKTTIDQFNLFCHIVGKLGIKLFLSTFRVNRLWLSVSMNNRYEKK